ncbi:MAG: hypothetical protein PHZ26_00255 [Candidatus Gracilibacteria bacterium]|nr:hypothetical protein [Candidatus Gracilibacteria bacterium]MDD2908168.1 hypothetical protein [Candidatus Gracilibacteria bacterium]
MRNFYKYTAFLLLLVPIFANAQISIEKTGDGGNLTSGYNFYEVGPNVSLQKDVFGDYFAGGGFIDISKKVSKDIMAAGGTIIISGDVGDDVRIAGGNIIITGNIAGDLIVAGGQINIKKGVKIGGNIFLNGGNIMFGGETSGDAFINGGNLNFDGKILGNAQFNVQTITVVSGSAIAGNLNYSSKIKSASLENTVSGKKSFTMIEVKNYKKDNSISKGFIEFAVGYVFYSFLFLVLFASLVYFNFENMFMGIATNLENKPGKSFLYGLIYFAIIPFAILLLLMSIIGIPFGLLLLVVYIFSFVFYKLVTVSVFASFFINKYLKDKTSFWKKLGIITLTSLFVSVLATVDFIAALFAFGAALQKKLELVKQIKK